MLPLKQERRLNRNLIGIEESSVLYPEPFEEGDIPEELLEEYVPLDESTFRIIEIKHRLSRRTHWYSAINRSIVELKEQVSDLQKQIVEITKSISETPRMYNATMYDLGTSEYELTVPIQMVLEEEQEETVARIPELNLYASADTDTEAINELKQEVINLYENLENSTRELGPLPRSWLRILKKLVIRKIE